MNRTRMCKRKREYDQKKQQAISLIEELQYEEDVEDVYEENVQLRA